MSRRRRWCPGLKLCHSDLAAAELHREWQEKRNARVGRSCPGRRLAVYFCPICKGYHIGHEAIVPPNGSEGKELAQTVVMTPSGPDA
jgi:hypothetical protein